MAAFFVLPHQLKFPPSPPRPPQTLLPKLKEAVGAKADNVPEEALNFAAEVVCSLINTKSWEPSTWEAAVPAYLEAAGNVSAAVAKLASDLKEIADKEAEVRSVLL